MGPKPRTPQTDELPRPRLDEQIKMSHPLVRLADLMNWEEIERSFRVIRVTNHDVMTNMDGVRAYIAEALHEAARPHPNPSPKEEGLKKADRKSPYPLGEGLGVGPISTEQGWFGGTVK